MLQTAAVFLATLLATHPIHSIREAGAEAWRPRPRPVRSEWCCQNLWLPARSSAQPGRFELRDHGYLREIIDAVDDINTREVVLLAAPQVGKTTLLQAIILSQDVIQRAPMMFATSTEDDAREKRNVIYELAEASPVLRDRVPPKRFRNDREIDFKTCLVYLAWSGSSQRLSGKSCRVVLCSECDRWERSVDLAVQRTKAFRASSSVVFEGSPVGTHSTLWDLYRASDRRKLQVPCPHCGHYQELRFFRHTEGPYKDRGGVAGIQAEGDEGEARWLSPEEGRRAAYYVCEKGCRIDEDDRLAMVRRGVWVPEGCHVDAKTGRVRGKPTYPGRRRGYQLNALYSVATGFGDAAETYLRVRTSIEGLVQFYNDVLGLEAPLPEVDLATVSAEELRRRQAGSRKGIAPDGCVAITVGIDTGRRRCHWTATGWQRDGSGRIFDYGTFGVDWKTKGFREGLKDALRLFSQVLAWPVEGTDTALEATQVWIDSGYWDHQDACYEACAELNAGLPTGKERWRPAKGHGSGQMQSRYSDPRKRTKEIPYIGRGFHFSWQAKANLLLVQVNADYYKGHLHECLKRPAEEAGSINLYRGFPGEHDEFSAHLTAEIPVDKHGLIVWEQIRGNNHWLDSTYLSVAAGRFVLELLDRPKEPKPQRGEEPDGGRPFLVSQR